MFKFIAILMFLVNITAFVPCSLYHDHECDDEHDFAQSGAEHNSCGGGVNHCVYSKIIASFAERVSPPQYSGRFNMNKEFSLIVDHLEKSIFHPPRLS